MMDFVVFRASDLGFVAVGGRPAARFLTTPFFLGREAVGGRPAARFLTTPFLGAMIPFGGVVVYRVDSLR